MQVALWLLVTSTLVPSVPPATATAPAVSVTAAQPAATPDAAQQRAQITPTSAASPAHRVGFGGSLAVSNVGVGGSTRYWFSKHVGVSMAAGWSRPRRYGYNGYVVPTANSSTVTAMPSVMVSFGQTDPDRAVSLRPYAGMGVSYVHATSRPGQLTNVPAGTYSNTTPVEFGGAEIFFRDHPRFALSVDGVYYRLPLQFVNRYYVNGLNVQVAAHFYLK